MKYVEIRKAFIEFFEEKKHQYVESSSLIPHNDPTLMFTNAGMNQFKDVFLGTDRRDYSRAVSIQKCLRAGGKHNDLENVGFTARHHTFFEMMGNFSFGDYFKQEAIEFAWEFLTKRLNIPSERLYVSVFETDDEAAEIWEKKIGVPKDKIFRFGEKDNFWRMGQTGPCGPCSEIFYDHNPSGPKIAIDQDEDRFVEIWNLVFMQFFEDENGKQTPLPKPSVDTGSGIERVCAAMQGVKDNYQCDIFEPLIHQACKQVGLKYDRVQLSQTPQTIGALKVVADHSRSTTFLIAEGVLPSNEGSGYVLRRIMRRAIRYARKLDVQKSLFPEICKEVIQVMGEHYPVLKEKEDFILQTVGDEEKRFLQTLDKGSEILNQEIQTLLGQQKDTLAGETAFTLYDTYGFPFDLTQVVAKEHDLNVDEKGFYEAMEKAKNLARSAQKDHSISSNEKHLADWSQTFKPTNFEGYEKLQLTTNCLSLSNGEAVVKSLPQSGWAIFDNSPFYAEGGGQVGDLGDIYDSSNNKRIARVSDCKKMNDVFLHKVEILEGELKVGDSYFLKVGQTSRQDTANNHSATHLLNAALKIVLGDHVNQAGSLVNAQKLRFDFNHSKGLTPKEIKKVETLVNQQIHAAYPVAIESMSQKEAVSKGAVAMFGEKYGDTVRVISMGETKDQVFSMELCGGTHVSNTAQIGLFKILSESGVAAGVRRIEAMTGRGAFQYLSQLADENLLLRESLKLKKPKGESENFSSDLTEKVEDLQAKIKGLEKDLKKKASQSVSVDDILKEGQEVTLAGEKGFAVFSRIPVSDRNLLSDVADQLRNKKDKIALVLIGEGEPTKPLIVAVSKSLKSVHAGKITQELCSHLDGKGGGRPDFAQGSVTNLDKLNLAKEKFYEFLQK